MRPQLRSPSRLRRLVLAAGLAGLPWLTTTGCTVTRVYDFPPPPPRQASYEEWPDSRTGTDDEVRAGVIVDSEPPPPRYEVVYESPGLDYVWIGGYWGWSGGWVWHSGGYRHCPPGYAWRGGVWVSSGRGYYYRRGGWVAPRGGSHFRHR